MDTLIQNLILTPFNILYKFSPELDLKLLFWLKQGYPLNLKAPLTYNEKLQWIKLYDRNPLMPVCCDKYWVRDYVKEQGCGEILNDLLWEGFDPEDIPIDALPEKFVIKATHGSTWNLICKNKDLLDKKAIVKKCNKWLKTKFLACYGEWFYGVKKPRIIVEDFIESQDDEQLRDYKVFCFGGRPRLIKVDLDRFTDHKSVLYDCGWNKVEGIGMGFPISERSVERPACLDELLEYASRLSAPFRHARVDFYIVGKRIFFGEITFTSGAGFDRFSSYDFDHRMGNWMKL